MNDMEYETATSQHKAGIGEKMGLWVAYFALKWRLLLLPIVLISVVLMASGSKHLEFSTNYRAFFSSDNPELIAFDQFQNIYTKNDNILFVVKPRSGSVFTADIGSVIESMTELAWQIPYASRVDSISNYQYSWAEEDDLIVDDLIRHADQLNVEDLSRKQAQALAEPLLNGSLLSPTAEATGINVTIQYPEKSLSEVPSAVAKAREIAAMVEAENPGVEVAISGISMLNNAFSENGQKDLKTLVPMMYGALLLATFIFLRSFGATIVTLLVVVFSVVTAMGLTGFIGIKLTPISAMAPTIILTLAIADSIHIIISMFAALSEGKDKRSAIIEAIRINFVPVSITSLTTVIGFLTLNFAEIPPFRDLGNISALGIVGAWLYSILFLPAALSLFPFTAAQKAERKESWLQRKMAKLADWVIISQKKILWTMGVLSLGFLMLIPTIELNDQWISYFDESIDFRQDSEFTSKHLTGSYIAELSIGSGEEGGIASPVYLAKLDEFAAWLRTQPEVRHVFVVTDIMKRLNKNMHGDDPAWFKLPDNRELAAQYLLMYELSLPYGLDLNDRINVDKSATRVSVNFNEVSTVQTRDFLDRSRQWLRDNSPETMWAEPTGATAMFAYISERNIHSMIGGNLLAIVMIAIVMIVSLRHLGIGLLSLIPNTLPMVMAFGIWALLVGQLGMAAASVTAISLGIIVDDSVHLLAKYLRARRELGLSKADAIRYAFATVGVAIVITTSILVVGFIVLSTSFFRPNWEMGALTGMTIVFALVIDLLLLPALLLLGGDEQEAKQKIDNNTQAQTLVEGDKNEVTV